MSYYLFPPPDPALKILEKKRRITYAAMSGLTAGTLCALILIFINTWAYPDLPLYIDPFNALMLSLFWMAGLSLFAGGSAYTAEGWGSIIPSSILMGAAVLLLNFLQGTSNLFLNVVVLAGLLIPFSGMLMPIGYLFFRLAERFIHARDLSGWARWRILIANALIIILLGALPGAYAKFNLRAEKSVYLVHAMLQENMRVNSPDALSKPLLNNQNFMEHRASPYTLSQAESRISTVGIDVTAHYADGYLIRCLVILYPDREPSISSCKEIQP